MVKRSALVLSSFALLGLMASGAPASASVPKPLPTALAGSRYSQTFTPSILNDSAWRADSNDPGNCPSHPGNVFVNKSGFLQENITSSTSDCDSVQSPHMYPTKPGYVYEADIYVSNANTWPAFWMYGNNWPRGGEIDAMEFNYGIDCVSWHSSSPSVSTCWNQTLTQERAVTWDKPVPGWHVVDIAFTATGIDVYYDGSLFIHVPETQTSRTDDQMWITASIGSCSWTCATTSQAGNLQLKWIRVFT